MMMMVVVVVVVVVMIFIIISIIICKEKGSSCRSRRTRARANARTHARTNKQTHRRTHHHLHGDEGAVAAGDVERLAAEGVVHRHRHNHRPPLRTRLQQLLGMCVCARA